MVVTLTLIYNTYKLANKIQSTYIFAHAIMSGNNNSKLVKAVTDVATLTGLVAGIGWIAKKIVKETFTADPSSNVMNYVEFMTVTEGSVALKRYLEDQKILPTPM